MRLGVLGGCVRMYSPFYELTNAFLACTLFRTWRHSDIRVCICAPSYECHCQAAQKHKHGNLRERRTRSDGRDLRQKLM